MGSEATREDAAGLASLDAAHAAAERLVRAAEEAARAAARDVPPRGWAAPGEPAEPEPLPPEVLQAVGTALELLRGTVPPELAQRLAEATRELLLALRAILDHNLERLERAD